MAKIKSKLLSDPEIARIEEVTITPDKAGSITWRRLCHSVAPSILAASITSLSIFYRFARKIISRFRCNTKALPKAQERLLYTWI